MNKKVAKENRLPREVWVAGISLKGLWPAKTIEQRMKDVLERMESVYWRVALADPSRPQPPRFLIQKAQQKLLPDPLHASIYRS